MHPLWVAIFPLRAGTLVHGEKMDPFIEQGMLDVSAASVTWFWETCTTNWSVKEPLSYGGSLTACSK